MANRVVNFSYRVQGLLVLVVILLHSIYSVYCVTTTTTKLTSTSPSSSSSSSTTQITQLNVTSIPQTTETPLITTTTKTTTTTTITPTIIPSVLQQVAPITTTSIPNRPIFLSDEILLRESVIMPSSIDSEKEAKELYDKALKQYGSYGASARNICAIWEARGCQCSGAVEELALSCRGIGFEEVPLDLPLEIVKL